jgi:hypothetical protein
MSDKTFADYLNSRICRSDVDTLAQHGASAGVPGLVYTSETTALYDLCEDDLWKIMADDADSFGRESALAHIASFNGADGVGSSDGFKNLVVWAAAESLALRDELNPECDE